MSAKMSILGMSYWNPDILDNFELPDSVELETLKGLIFSETAELEVLYSDPDIFKAILKFWSHARVNDWKRVELTLNADYNPIENYDRTETHSDVYTRELAENGNVVSEGTTNDRTKKAAFNSADMVDTDSATGSSNNTDEHNTSYTGGDSRNINIRAHGNIGVTTNQQMISAEIELRRKNLYDIIIDEFITKFCLGVY